MQQKRGKAVQRTAREGGETRGRGGTQRARGRGQRAEGAGAVAAETEGGRREAPTERGARAAGARPTLEGRRAVSFLAPRVVKVGDGPTSQHGSADGAGDVIFCARRTIYALSARGRRYLWPSVPASPHSPSFSTLNYDRDAPHAHTPQRLTSSLSHTNSIMALFYVCVLLLAATWCRL